MNVYLYGHYDSRGGTIAIEAPSREAADAAYDAAFGGDDAEVQKIWAEYQSHPHTEDFLTEIELRFDGVDPATFDPAGEELDMDCDRAVFISGCPAHTNDCEPEEGEEIDRYCECLPDSWESRHLLCAPIASYDEEGRPETVPAGYYHPRWDDDAFGFVLQKVSA